jgi:single-strand DNA-binding protein
MQIKGTIREIYAANRVSEKFIKRDLVVTIDGTYPQYIKMQCTQDRCAMLDNFQVGDSVTVDINIRGKQYEKKDGTGHDYFTTIEAWKITKDGAYTPSSTPAQTTNDHGGLSDDNLF